MLVIPTRSVPRSLRWLTLLLIAPLAALLPLGVRAGVPGANPAAVRFTIAIEAQTPNGSFSLSGNGVADISGDLQMHLDLNVPEQHSADYIMAGGTSYISLDGGPYEAVAAPGPAGGSLGGFDASCLSTASQANLGDLGTLLGPSASVQDLGPESLNGSTVDHVHVQLDLATALPALAPLLQQTLLGCGLPANQIDQLNQLSSLADQSALAGSTLELDTYVDTATQFLQRLNLALDAPNVPANLMIQETFTPLSTPVTITPPAGF